MRRAVLAVSALLFVAGCGGGDETDGAAPPASSPAAAETTKAPEKASGGGGATTVTIEDFTFEPGKITVSAGDEVTWTNVDSANHNVVFDGDAVEGIENLRQDEDGSVTFDEAGTFSYVCSYHPGMEGSVVVQ